MDVCSNSNCGADPPTTELERDDDAMGDKERRGDDSSSIQMTEEEQIMKAPKATTAEEEDAANKWNKKGYLATGTAVVLVAALVSAVVLLADPHRGGQPKQSPTASPSSQASSLVMLFGQEWDPRTTTRLDGSNLIPLDDNMTLLTYLGDDCFIGGRVIDRTSIPAELGLLSKLTHLDFGGSCLEGTIPATALGQLTELKYLHLGGNALDGSIPSELGLMTKLTYLVLADNTLSGPIPAEIGALTKLVGLDLSTNVLSGPVPSDALSNLLHLEQLWLYLNDLSGSIRPSLCSVVSPTIDCNEIACDCCGC